MADFFYKGDEIKFSIDLQAPGFSMDDDDFDIEVKSSRGGTPAAASKESPAQDGSLVIFKEEGTWYAIVDTTNLAAGDLTVVATAHIPDAHANDGIRRQSDVKALCPLKAK